MYKRILATVAVASMAVFSVAFAASQFSDVPADHWAADSISWANEMELMTGPADMPGMFDPAGEVNRAQLATVLHRYDEMMMDKMDKMEAMMAEEEVVEEEEEVMEEELAMYYVADLDGDQEVPAVVTDAMGSATLELIGSDLTYSLSVEGLSGDITGAHIHMGATGENGDALHTITFDGMTAEGTWEGLTEEQMTTLVEEGFYLNIHTAANPDGEIRGQIMVKEDVMMEEEM